MSPPLRKKLASLLILFAMILGLVPNAALADPYEPVTIPLENGWHYAHLDLTARGQAYLITGEEAGYLCGVTYPDAVVGVAAHDPLPRGLDVYGKGGLHINPVPFVEWDPYNIYPSLAANITREVQTKAAQLQVQRGGRYVRAIGMVLVTNIGGGTVCKEISDTEYPSVPPPSTPPSIRETPPASGPPPSITVTSAPSCSPDRWNNDTKYEGYGLTPVGGAQESRIIVSEVWRADPSNGAVLESYVVILPARHTMWIQRHTGAHVYLTCFATMEEAIASAQGTNVPNVTSRDRRNPQLIVLPRDAGAFLRLVRLDTPSGTITGPASAEPQGPAAQTAGVGSGSTSSSGSGQTASANPGRMDGRTAYGPAICEFGRDGKSVVKKVNSGATFTLPPDQGSCFPFPNQGALDARWPDHVREFQARYGGNAVVES